RSPPARRSRRPRFPGRMRSSPRPGHWCDGNMVLTTAQHISLLKQMWRIRMFEEQAIRLYGEGYYRGSTHPYIGQEATAVGACAALRPGDPVLATYRGHGVCIAKGGDPKRMMAEILGKANRLRHG